jgi:hypothetical protein
MQKYFAFIVNMLAEIIMMIQLLLALWWYSSTSKSTSSNAVDKLHEICLRSIKKLITKSSLVIVINSTCFWISAVTLIITAVISTEKFIPISYLATFIVGRRWTAIVLSAYTRWIISVLFLAFWACDCIAITINNITLKDKIKTV